MKFNIVRYKGAAASALLFYILLRIVSVPVFGQHYHFKTFTMDDGLGDSVINTVYQDRKGFLWIGTHGGGVDRFDGNTFINYSKKNGLSDNSVSCIMEDRNGHLWIATLNGLNKYDNGNFTVYTKEDGLSGNSISNMVEDRNGNLWFATYSNGVSRYDGRNFTTFTTADGLIDSEVRCILEDRAGNLWFATPKGVNKYEGAAFNTDVVTRRLQGYFVQYILEDNNGNLWFGTRRNGVLCFNGETFTSYTSKEGLCENDVSHIMQDSSGNFWFSTFGGASKFDGHMFTNYTTRQGLRYDEVTDILEDREGNIWMATSIGVSCFRGEILTYLNEKEGLKNNIVWSFWEDHQGTMWIATEGGIATYDQKDKIIKMAEGKYCKGHITLFYEDSKGNLWFCSDDSIIKYNGHIYTDFSKRNNLVPLGIYCILEDRHGNMWFGTEDRGVMVWDGNTIRSLTKEKGLLNNLINDLLEDKQGNIWIATPEGLCKYDGVNFSHITTANGLTNNFVMCLEKDRENSLWIGTYGGGIVRYKLSQINGDAEFEAITTEDGLLTDEILSLLFDDDGNLWIASKKSLTQLDVVELNKTGKRKFKHYDRDHGYPGIEPNEGAIYKDKAGNIWLGTINGAIKFNPKEDKPNTLEPATYITGLKLFHEKVDWSDDYHKSRTDFGLPLGVELSHNRNHLTFEFVGICLTVPGKVRYQVMLEGFDENWSPVSKDNHAIYSNLPPGEYAFKVKACNNDGLWNKKPAVYRFRIIPPFWKTWWFYLLVSIAVISSGYGFIKLRTRKLRKQKRILEQQVHLRTLELEKEKAKVEQINEELEQRVEERTRKLEIANKQLLRAQKMEAIGTLAAGVAHDLNNILAGIVSYPELMLLKIPQDDPLRKHALAIQHSGEKAAAIVQDLLTLARRSVEVTKVVNLNQVVGEFMESPELMKILSYQPEIEVEDRLDKDLKNMIGSTVHLSKALMNLVSNAAEAMPGKGKIIISTFNTYFSQPLDGYREVVAGDYVALSVTDTGIGISEKDMTHIFEPFYTKKRMGKSGTGLGMTVVWGTVKDHNGYLTAKSEKGKGSAFTLYFPATQQKVIKEKLHVSIDQLMGNGESILVVDDVEEQREITTLILKQLGYSVQAVSSGEAAIETVKTRPVNLLVLDMIMDPGISGLETYKRILNMYPRQKAIIVSGYSETKEAKEALQLGAGTYIKKPFGMEQIGRAVKDELKRA
ncbi:MAG: response regulator [Candidatus Aminicenantes bacterium]|nr:response regulator [Candidatus Aminicenantes bacterium]